MANAKSSSTERLFEAVREAQEPSLRLTDAGEHARARARLLQVIDEVDRAERPVALPQARAPRARWGLVGTLAAAACAFALMISMPGESGQPEALAFTVDGVAYGVNQMIVSEDGERLLAFTDDTRIDLAPEGSMQMTDLRSNGATVMLVDGEVELAVHHEDDTSWQVHAGPWSVHVTGTQFVVEWEPSTEYFRVAVSEGSVRVEGPNDELANLRAGQELVRQRGKAKIEPETLQIADARQPGDQGEGEQLDRAPSIEVPAGEEPEPETMADDVEQAEVREQRRPKPSAPALTWIDHFDNADFDRAWDSLAALSDGIHGEAKGADAATILDLADVARFTKHHGDAAKLLEHLRDEHAGSNEAALAAFTLGRLTASRGSQAKAASYFEDYLDERPAGSHAGDALGRLMDCYVALGDGSKARATAQKYLGDNPKGPHAEQARSILGL